MKVIKEGERRKNSRVSRGGLRSSADRIRSLEVYLQACNVEICTSEITPTEIFKSSLRPPEVTPNRVKIQICNLISLEFHSKFNLFYIHALKSEHFPSLFSIKYATRCSENTTHSENTLILFMFLYDGYMLTIKIAFPCSSSSRRAISFRK